MYKLNLPTYEPTLKKEQGKVWIFDVIRKKYIVLTPEEWVRQHFINFLVTEMKYPKSLFRIEGSLTYNKLQKRSDILVFDRTGKSWMLIECKSPTIKLNQKAFNQVAVYNMTLGAKYLAVTNGMAHFCFEAASPGNEPKALQSFPQFE
ncbi:MAG TPA: restriction endonuclease subunit R [Cytophagales bacterium]|jgi:predicted type IV restriction endonuclease|nr:restriction endonuclease subunit R [Cytophagales bacterium]